MSFRELVSDMDDVALATFGDADELAITYAPQGGAAVPVVGIFDEQYVLAKGSANAGVETLSPAVFFRLDDLPADPMNDEPTIVIGGVSYRVHERLPDGIGGIVLAVRKKS